MSKSILDFWKQAAAEITDTSAILDTKEILETKKILSIDDNEKNAVIFFVNGHYSKLIPGPSSGGKKYWDYFDTYIYNTAANYFEVQDNYIVEFANVSSSIVIDSSGGQRKNEGYNYAKNSFNTLQSKLNGNKIFFVAHSEGCAFAVGMAKFYFENNLKIEQVILLSCDEGDEFEIDFNVDAYQIEYMYWGRSLSDENCEPQFDWIINTDRTVGGVFGINKFGIVKTNLEFNTMHGSTANSEVFKEIEDLKAVIVLDNLNKNGKSFLSQINAKNNTKFYQVGKKVLDTNHPQWNSKTFEIDLNISCNP